jgi:hypothetical protein
MPEVSREASTKTGPRVAGDLGELPALPRESLGVLDLLMNDGV